MYLQNETNFYVKTKFIAAFMSTLGLNFGKIYTTK